MTQVDQLSDLAAVHDASSPNPCRSVNHLIDLRARTHPDRLAVAFPEPVEGSSDWSCASYTFAQLRSASLALAARYARLLPRRTKPEERLTVALLCPSGPQYLLAVLACIRLGLGVLLLAPQLPPEAVAHLLKTTSATHILLHESMGQLGRAGAADLEVRSLSILDLASKDTGPDTVPSHIDIDDEAMTTAIFFHSSGSSGMPKPIPTAHRLLTSVYPCTPSFPDGKGEPRAAFSTTPLFHGGLTDLFRALNALEPIYFFPLHRLPVTANHVQAALTCAGPTVRYFFTVPFILKLLLEADALDPLKRMDLVSSGGAPLSDEMGDHLVELGINLVSRYGSSECGFMLSSHRDYATDKHWQWLREPVGTSLGQYRRFVPLTDDTAELHILPGWPHQVLSNRPDGSYATGDLFTRHSSIPHAWRYAGRADDVLVLSNGEKVDPSAFESHLRVSPHLVDAVVFGVDRPATGVLLHFAPNIERHTKKEDLVEMIWPEIVTANEAMPTHGQILREMVVPLTGEDAVQGFPTASKGSIQRQQVYTRYAELIDTMYRRFDAAGVEGGDGAGERPDEAKLQEIVVEVITATLGGRTVKPIELDADLFVYGLNSLQTARVRNVLQRRLDMGGATLVSNVVYENPSVRRLAKHIIDVREGRSGGPQDVHGQMQKMVDRYAAKVNDAPYLNGHSSDISSNVRSLLVLTGATGSLGAHVLHLLLSDPSHNVACLVRADSDSSASSRIVKSLQQRRLPPLTAHQQSRLQCYAAALGQDRLGLADAVYAHLRSHAKAIIHLAWAVNFVASFSSFETEHIGGVANLALLARDAAHRPVLMFGSSTASVLGRYKGTIEEAWPDDAASVAPSMGYAQSKWVAEKLCQRLHRVEVRVLRIGQLCGDTTHGVWNETEAWPMLLRSATMTGCLPRLDERLTWLPVDLCARSILDILAASSPAPIVQLCNTHNEATWSDLLSALRREGLAFEEVEPVEWLRRLEASESNEQLNPARKLLGLWQASYGEQAKPRMDPVFSVTKACEASPTMAQLSALDEKVLRRIAKHVISPV